MREHEFIAAARTLSLAGAENIEQVKDALEEVLTHKSLQVSTAGGFCLIELGVEDAAKEWYFSQLDDTNPPESRTRAAKALQAMASTNVNKEGGVSDAVFHELLDAFAALLRDQDATLRETALTALSKLGQGNDTIIAELERQVLECSETGSDPEMLLTLAKVLSLVRTADSAPASTDVAMALRGGLEAPGADVQCRCAASLCAIAPKDKVLLSTLQTWTQGAEGAELQIAGLRLLGETQSRKPAVISAVLATIGDVTAEQVQTHSEQLATAFTALGTIGASDDAAVLASIKEIILLGYDQPVTMESAHVKGAALRALATLDSTPELQQFAGLVNMLLTQQAGTAFLLWPACGEALQALCVKKKKSRTEQQTEYRALSREAFMRILASTHIERGGIAPPVEIALEFLEQVLVQAPYCSATAEAAATALSALKEPSDVLASYLLEKLTDIGMIRAGEARPLPADVSACMAIRDPKLIRNLTSKASSSNFEVRQACLDVIASLEISSDTQLYHVLSVIPELGGSFLTEGAMVYFRGLIKQHRMYKVNVVLHRQMLRMARENPACIDVPYILRELKMAGSLNLEETLAAAEELPSRPQRGGKAQTFAAVSPPKVKGGKRFSFRR